MDDDEKDLVIKLTKEFGEASSTEVAQLLRTQQDMMCTDVVAELEKKLTQMMSDPPAESGAASNPAEVAQIVTAMISNVRKSVEQVKGVSASVSQRAVSSLVNELAAEHLGTLLRFITQRSEAVATKSAVAQLQARVRSTSQYPRGEHSNCP